MMFVLFLVLLTGSHVLTGTIAWIRIVDELDLCALIWGFISAILLYCPALPPTVHDFVILGYTDVTSFIVAFFVTMVATGVETSNAPGGMSAVPWFRLAAARYHLHISLPLNHQHSLCLRLRYSPV